MTERGLHRYDKDMSHLAIKAEIQRDQDIADDSAWYLEWVEEGFEELEEFLAKHAAFLKFLEMQDPSRKESK